MPNEIHPTNSKFKKTLFIFTGSLSLVLGIIGAFVPLMPTTVFLLITAYFYVRSSPKLYNWLIRHRIFGKYIENYRKYKEMPKRAKILAISMLWITIIVSSFILSNLWISILLITVAVSVTAYILSIKTLDERI